MVVLLLCGKRLKTEKKGVMKENARPFAMQKAPKDREKGRMKENGRPFGAWQLSKDNEEEQNETK